MSFRIGDTLGEYKIVGVLGRGGMGQVFRVEHSLTKRIEALKVLVAHPLEGAEPASRFLREVKIHASLNHPNIVTVHNAFQVGDDLALVMELVEGQSLRDLIGRRNMPMSSGLHVICDVLAGLSYAHDRGVIHRDISPSNIIVTENGEAKLMDFGLSKVVAEPGMAQSGVVLGTVYYCSPEQVKGSTDLDARSDIYSLGVVLYEVVTGSRPFDSATPFSIMMEHIDSAPVSPSGVNPDVPQALSDVVLKAMAKSPEHRFQTAGEFLQSLQLVLSGLGEKSATRRMPRTPFWRSVAENCAVLFSRRRVQAACVALGLAFPLAVLWVNAVGYGAPDLVPPPVVVYAPPVPENALELSQPQQDPDATPGSSGVPATLAAANAEADQPPGEPAPPQPSLTRAHRSSSVPKSVVQPKSDAVSPAHPVRPQPVDFRSKPDQPQIGTMAALPTALTSPAPAVQEQNLDQKTGAPALERSSPASNHTAPNADNQPKNGLHRMFDKVFHHRKKNTASPADAASE